MSVCVPWPPGAFLLCLYWVRELWSLFIAILQFRPSGAFIFIIRAKMTNLALCAAILGLESNLLNVVFPESETLCSINSWVSLHWEPRLLSLTSSSDLSVFSAVTDAYQMAGRGCSCWFVRSDIIQVFYAAWAFSTHTSQPRCLTVGPTVIPQIFQLSHSFFELNSYNFRP